MYIDDKILKIIYKCQHNQQMSEAVLRTYLLGLIESIIEFVDNYTQQLPIENFDRGALISRSRSANDFNDIQSLMLEIDVIAQEDTLLAEALIKITEQYNREIIEDRLPLLTVAEAKELQEYIDQLQDKNSDLLTIFATYVYNGISDRKLSLNQLAALITDSLLAKSADEEILEIIDMEDVIF